MCPRSETRVPRRHLDEVARRLAACYAKHDATAGGAARALDVAKRDVFAWWRLELDAMALALLRVAAKARTLLGVDVRVFYRTSPPASDRWVRYYDYAKAHALDRTKTPERRPWMRAGGGCEAPLPNASAVYEPPPGEDEYGHDQWDTINAAAVAAFTKRGHAILDVAAMLGARVDAHPASLTGRQLDGLHFCIPGPLDYVLDLALARVRSAFDRAPPRLDDEDVADVALSRATLKVLAAAEGRAPAVAAKVAALLKATPKDPPTPVTQALGGGGA